MQSLSSGAPGLLRETVSANGQLEVDEGPKRKSTRSRGTAERHWSCLERKGRFPRGISDQAGRGGGAKEEGHLQREMQGERILTGVTAWVQREGWDKRGQRQELTGQEVRS